jgi:two-component system, NarL family, nitrate/nitrite response regulator NarL
MPVDEVGEGVGENAGQAQTPKLLGAPLVDEQFVIVDLDGFLGVVAGYPNPFHRALLPGLLVWNEDGTIAVETRFVIGASSDLRARVTELFGFPLAAMRGGTTVCQAACMPIRCLIVDDHRPFLEAAESLLEREGLKVVGVATTTSEALAQVEALRPNVVLVDVSLGEENGFDLARRLHEAGDGLETTVVMISTRAEEDIADLLAESPAAGFVPKAGLSAAAIRQVVDGRVR